MVQDLRLTLFRAEGLGCIAKGLRLLMFQGLRLLFRTCPSPHSLVMLKSLRSVHVLSLLKPLPDLTGASAPLELVGKRGLLFLSVWLMHVA